MRRILPVLALSLALAQPASARETLLLTMPTVSKTHVAFVYGRELWIASREGGNARRLTARVGGETRPKFSPDGKWIAFSANYGGNADVYVISVDGGAAKRLTYHPGYDIVRDWHPDGTRILFTSRRADANVDGLWHVSVDGGTPTYAGVPRAYHGTYNAAGTHIAYTPTRDAFSSWKRYRGGRTTPIWIFDCKTQDVEEIPHVNASDTYPTWHGGWVYFGSARGKNGRMDLYRYQPGSKKQPEQLTHFKDFDLRNIDACGDTLVLEQGGALHLYDPAKKALRRLSITVLHDGLGRLPRWQTVGNAVRWGEVSPNGKRCVFEARGEIVTVPRSNGDARHLTRSPGAHDRMPLWHPRGEQICWVSDASGEYRLILTDRLGRKSSKSFDLGPGGYYHLQSWSPDGKHVLFQTKGGRLAYLTIATSKVTEVDVVAGSLGVPYISTSWSKDSRWIAYTQRNPRTLFDRIVLYEMKTGKKTPLTDHIGHCGSPAFDREGKYLYFTASVNSGPKKFGLDLGTQHRRSSNSNIYVCVLKKGQPHPLAPRSDEGANPKKKPARKPKKGGRLIDLDDIDQRILALPIGSGNYSGLECGNGRLLYVDRKAGRLMRFDFAGRKAVAVRNGVWGFDISADGNHVLCIGGGKWGLCNTLGQGYKQLAIDKVKVRVVPAEEWMQILREAWRLQRDYFYDPNFHGVDWDAMWERWYPFVAHCAHRYDLNRVIAEMIGELACGHNYVSGGESGQTGETGHNVGLLGCNWSADGDRYKITRIFRGQNWNPRLRAPLTGPGVDARVGDYLVSIDGKEVTTKGNLYAAFEGTAGRQVSLVLSANLDGSKPRTMTVVPLSNEGTLRKLAWVEANRARVDKLSDGKLAYAYMPNTAGAGLAAFDRDFYSQVDRSGLILDERFNGGGKVADYVIRVLRSEPMCYWMSREGWLGRTPFGTMTGPKVMVINEYAGSGGDAMPWLFKRHKIGPLVGKRTWGGLVGVSGYPTLVDGGRVTAASFGVMDTDGNWAVENVGVAPDHAVEQLPKLVNAGRDPQLEKAVALALEALKKAPARKLPTYHPPAPR